MNELEATPGPWQWWTSCSWRRLKNMDGAEVLTPFVNRADGHPDCTVSDADAALIAAAPELYAALEMFVEKYVAMVHSGDCGHWNPENEDFVMGARAALKKARGEA